jgi:nanoRNase/pAp phosphatase (c-di-AMP/oligoRNAs hydrolase)
MKPSSLAATQKKRYKQLLENVSSDDVLGIMINADPDAMSSALALKRLFWHKVKKTVICRVNAIKRSDNLAMIKLLGLQVPYVNRVDTSQVTKWAIVDGQPHHHPRFSKVKFDIIIDATALFYGIKTDTANFARASSANDIKGFKYLYPFVNLNIIKKIESSEINKANLAAFQAAFEALEFIGNAAYIHMGEVDDADSLVILADFFLKMAEANWCFVSGIYGHKVIIIVRNAGFRLHAGKLVQRLFGDLGSAGGHRSAARVEIPLEAVMEKLDTPTFKVDDYIRKKITEK